MGSNICKMKEVIQIQRQQWLHGTRVEAAPPQEWTTGNRRTLCRYFDGWVDGLAEKFLLIEAVARERQDRVWEKDCKEEGVIDLTSIAKIIH